VTASLTSRISLKKSSNLSTVRPIGPLYSPDYTVSQNFFWEMQCSGGGLAQLVVTLVRSTVSTGMGDRIGSTPGVENLSPSNQPPRSIQPGHPSVGRGNEYRSKGGDVLQLGVKADMVLFADNTV